MKYYPLLMDINHSDCLVVGGGRVGQRKTIALIDCGAKVTVISLDFTDALAKMAESGNPLLLEKEYSAEDLAGKTLVFAATDNRGLNERVKRDSEKRGVLCNIADDPGGSRFIVPSVVERGDLLISVSTSGKSPALARKIKKDISEAYGPEYEEYLVLMGDIRKRVLAGGHDPDNHKLLFRRVIDRDIPLMIKEGRYADIATELKEIIGQDWVKEIVENLRNGRKS
jgi:precorrin-2 dehydrogenase/sirohydrochlorin ferrochelatase